MGSQKCDGFTFYEDADLFNPSIETEQDVTLWIGSYTSTTNNLDVNLIVSCEL